MFCLVGFVVASITLIDRGLPLRFFASPFERCHSHVHLLQFDTRGNFSKMAELISLDFARCFDNSSALFTERCIFQRTTPNPQFPSLQSLGPFQTSRTHLPPTPLSEVSLSHQIRYWLQLLCFQGGTFLTSSLFAFLFGYDHSF
jgi:hypothetical protein